MKNILAFALFLCFSVRAFSVEVTPGQADDPKAAQVEQKDKHTAAEKSFEEKREMLKKKHIERKARGEQKKTQKTDEPVLQDSKELMLDIQKEIHNQNPRDNQNN